MHNGIIPPGNDQLILGMHWLEIRDYDGHSFGCIALQWNPGSKTWSHSNQHDTAKQGIDTKYWRYIKPIPLPTLEEMIQTK